ncbi:TPA: low temperature requirement protein A [Streptococcus suis 14A]|uniref:low temperature requirement protein A n=1 Tax=Streptococcus suis TaxID=1307 RepID=UPI0004A788A7|nr:low temperature requirement protein A [Streptococcus suis]HEM3198740.1 low temperature requirement protein A [Streptococcus suis 14A]
MSEIIAKRVSNYELFYDLVFVLATSSLTGLLHGDHIGLREILTFITANLIIMTLWINETIYLNKYGERDLLDIITIIASMFVVGQLSLNFSHDFEATALPFTIFLTLSYLLICLQYYLRGRKIGFTADMKHSLYMFGIYLLVFFLALVAIYFNFWTYDEKSLLLFYLPFFISYFFKDKLSHDVMNFPHIVERCQLITIITFGEMVIAILKNYPILELPLEGILLFFAMASLFIFYISQTYLTIDHHRKADATVLLYAHLVIVLGLNFFTVAMELFPSHHNDLALPMLIVGNVLFYSGILSTSFYNQQVHQVGRRGLFIYALILLIGNVALLLDGHSNILLFVILNLLSHAMIAYHVIRFRKANHSLLGEDI